MRHLYIITLLFLVACNAHAQRNCVSMEVLEEAVKSDPGFKSRMEAIENQTSEFARNFGKRNGARVVVTIPVVFHVLYRTAAENISDAQLQSQLNVLNDDFRFTNADKTAIPQAFAGLAADSEVEFCLATQSPTGAATSGIERKSTTKTSWGTTTNVKYSSKGGLDAWPAGQYLNIWVCNIGNNILGYATFPGGNAAVDGVVLDFRCTGSGGSAVAPFNLGRTATHEVGHWLNLRHIWGDASCGSDLVSDTPVHATANYNCPSHPKQTSCSGGGAEMFMNYMDYVDDNCMQMFTTGQKVRMRAILDGGVRASLASSPGCLPPGNGTCAIPAGLASSNVTSTSATVSWQAVTNATSYTVQYKTEGSSAWISVTSSTNTVGITGLNPATTYNVQVASVCTGGQSGYSSISNFTTTSGGAGCTDPYDVNSTNNNDSKNKSSSLSPAVTISAKIGTATDIDWYKFNNTVANRNVRVTMNNLPADYDMILYRSNSQVGISQNSGTADEVITYNNTQNATTYYVKVFSKNGAFSASNCYNLLPEISATSLQRQANSFMNGDEPELVMEEFQAFPNPTDGELTLWLPFGRELQGRVCIADLTGRIVYTENLSGNLQSETVILDVSNLKNGVYLVSFSNGQSSHTRKIVITQRQ